MSSPYVCICGAYPFLYYEDDGNGGCMCTIRCERCGKAIKCDSTSKDDIDKATAEWNQKK